MLPQIRVNAVRTAFADGNHNAFTDLCRFQGAFYLTFRSCHDGHMVHPTSRIVVLRSEDAQHWETVHTFGVPGRDVRDPHFLAFQGKLFVYSGTWLYHPEEPERRDVNEHLGYGVWSADGRAWQGPQILEGTYGHYVWRAAAHGGQAYLCGYRKRGMAPISDEGRHALMEAALLESDDGLIWKYVGLFRESYASETAFLFEEDGDILAISRGAGDHPAQVCRSHPPYKVWERQDLDRNVGGPVIARWGERTLVGGRKYGPHGSVTALYWLVEGRLHQAAELPSGGDNSYPGFVALSDAHGLVSYYSSHQGSGTHLAPSAIYLADVSVA